jgi:Sec-independent protein secretion pathway component TatC
LGAAVAPLAAPVVAVPILLALSHSQTIGSILLIAILSCGIAYGAMYLIVVPIFLTTRKRFTWTKLRIVILAALISVFPVIAVELYEFVRGLALGRDQSFVDRLSRLRLDIVMMLLGCAIAVSMVYVAVQVSKRPFDAD